MPNKQTHQKLTTIIFVPTFAVGTFQLAMMGQPEIFVASLGIGITFAIQNDLDLAENRKKTIFNLYAWPYAKLMHHRSKWSHGIIVSTFIRFIYFLWPLLFLNIDPSFYIWLFVGMVASDTLHTVADKLSTWFKTRSRKH